MCDVIGCDVMRCHVMQWGGSERLSRTEVFVARSVAFEVTAASLYQPIHVNRKIFGQAIFIR